MLTNLLYHAHAWNCEYASFYQFIYTLFRASFREAWSHNSVALLYAFKDLYVSTK